MTTELKVKHTPTLDYSMAKPWRIRLTSNHDYIAVDGAADPNDGTSPLIFEKRNPSEWLIRALQDSVRAVNAHDELVRALRRAKHKIRSPNSGPDELSTEEVLDEIEAALAKAEGR